LPIFHNWLRGEDAEFSVPVRFLDLVFDYDWTLQKLHQLDLESMISFTLNDFGKQFLWNSLKSLDITAIRLRASETDSFALGLASTCPNLICLRLFFEQMSSDPFEQIVQNCPHLETWELGIDMFDHNAALDSLGKSSCKRPMNVCFHVDLSQAAFMEEEVYSPPTLTSAGIIAFARSNIELLSFAVFFKNAYGDRSETIRDFCDGIDKLKDIRNFAYLKCHRTSAEHYARIVGTGKRLVMFVPTYRYRKNDNFIRQDMFRFTIDDEYMVEEEEEEEEVGKVGDKE
jgi:hypothetical protein